MPSPISGKPFLNILDHIIIIQQTCEHIHALRQDPSRKAANHKRLFPAALIKQISPAVHPEFLPLWIHISEINIHTILRTFAYMSECLFHPSHIIFIHYGFDCIQIIGKNVIRNPFPVFTSIQDRELSRKINNIALHIPQKKRIVRGFI